MKVCLGGTFYPFHKGHKELLRKAFQVAGAQGSVFIGLTAPTMITKKGKIASFEKRKQTIMQFLDEEHVLPRVSLQPLLDKYGPTIEDDFDAIVVSPETKITAEEINRKRTALGKKPLRIIIIPFVLSEDRLPISSSRIRRKEINENGKRATQD
ncbi:MAG TPA: pantetheine-phosphate adenylyltransferase [Thermoplasmata archaeon]|nr:pantetheine-phosphate adenylyltransferase [Thermoplasmata archaeon]